MAGTASSPLRSILVDRREPCLKLKHGVRIPLDPAIVQIVARYEEESIWSGDFRAGDDEHPGDDSPFPIEVHYRGGSGSITPHCYLLRVSYPCEFYALAVYEEMTTSTPEWDSSGGWWREDVLIPHEEIVQLCSDFEAQVLDERLQAAVEAHEEREWARWSERNDEVYELLDEPDGPAVRFRGKVAKFDSDERVHCRLLCEMLTAYATGRTSVPVTELRRRLGSKAQNDRWAYNIVKVANRRAEPLELEHELVCGKGAESVVWEQIASMLPLAKAA